MGLGVSVWLTVVGCGMGGGPAFAKASAGRASALAY